MKNNSLKHVVKSGDYKPLDWFCHRIFLNFKIFDKFVLVESKLFFKANKYKTNKSISYLYLYGKELQTQSATINYGFKTIDKFIDQINLDKGVVKIKIPKATKNIIFKSKVKVFQIKIYLLKVFMIQWYVMHSM